MPEGNIVCGVIGELQTEPRSRTPARVTHSLSVRNDRTAVIKATSEAQKFLGES